VLPLDGRTGRAMTTGNGFLDSLPSRERQTILAQSELATFKSAEVIASEKAALVNVVFPISSMIAILHKTDAGDEAETSSVGREGMLGSRLVLGDQRLRLLTVCSIAGEGYRLPIGKFLEVANKPGRLYDRSLRYTAARLIEAAQCSACHRFHLPVQRCARWLLIAHDRVGRRTLEITHEFLGRLMGMPRTALTLAVGTLKERGAIVLGRGSITIRDRRKLEAASCECYRKIAAEFKRLNGAPAASRRRP
jgi:CRP-like cAMP-binding protein